MLYAKFQISEQRATHCSIEWFKIIAEIDFEVASFPKAFAGPELKTGRIALLPLGELETLAGARSAVLFTFDNTCISREEAPPFESGPMS